MPPTSSRDTEWTKLLTGRPSSPRTDVLEAAPLLPPGGSVDAGDGETRPKVASPSIRGDIQGLRAVAVLMVLAYHAGLPFARGGFAGVDVFFVLSGFLITGLIAREIERTGALSLTAFWARRARRLLPSAALVLVVVSLGSIVLLPQTRWGMTAGDVVAAAGNVINWRLAAASVDYLAQDYAPSPVQHFWSLAVEEQFYLFWPLLVLALTGVGRWATRRHGLSIRAVLLIGIAVVTAASLIWSVHQSHDPAGFFVTTTRIWELGIGAVMALAERRTRRLNAHLAAALTWIGLLVLVAVIVLLPDTVPWPGYAALIPTLATAALIAGGPQARRAGAAWVLDRRIMRAIGDLSYVLYLWHWPMLVFATAQRHHPLSAHTGLLVVLLSFVPAGLTHRFLEDPVRRSRRLARAPLATLGVAATCIVSAVVAAVALLVAIPGSGLRPGAVTPGAAALISDPGTAVPGPMPRSISPDPLRVAESVPDLYVRGCQADYDGAAPTPCVFDADPAATASGVTVALVGDSRAAQWSPTLQAVAAQQHWRVITLTKAGCPLAHVAIGKGGIGHRYLYTSCVEWNAAVMNYLLSPATKPDLVVTSSLSPYVSWQGGRTPKRSDNVRALVAGFRSTWLRLNEAGVPVIAMRETPVMLQLPGECVAENRTNPANCGASRQQAMSAPQIMQPAGDRLDATAVLDLTSKALCVRGTCPAVIGNVMVYRDKVHLTAEYARSMAPFLSRAMAKLRDRHFAGGRLDSMLPTS